MEDELPTLVPHHACILSFRVWDTHAREDKKSGSPHHHDREAQHAPRLKASKHPGASTESVKAKEAQTCSLELWRQLHSTVAQEKLLHALKSSFPAGCALLLLLPKTCLEFMAVTRPLRNEQANLSNQKNF